MTLNCDPSKVDAGKTTHCEANVSAHDDGSPAGAVTFTSSDSHGTFGKATCSTGSGDNNAKSLVCEVDYTPSTSGDPTTIKATYPGDASHSPSTSTFELNGDKRR